MCKLHVYSFEHCIGQGIFSLEVNKPLGLQITLGSESHVSHNETLLQILLKQAVFSFAVLCIFMLHCPVFFGAVGLFRSDMLLIF